MLQSSGGHDCRNGTSEPEQKWDKCASGEPKPAHDVIHDKGNSGHISAVFQKCEGKEQNEYIGMGVAAHSYTNDTRYSNIDTIEGYIENYKNGKQVENFVFHEKQDK